VSALPGRRLTESTVPNDLLELLQNDKTVLDTCVDLFTIADFFTLGMLCRRAADVMTECLIRQATSIQSHIRRNAVKREDPDWKGLSTKENKEFLARFFDTAKRVYSMGPSSFGMLKNALLLFPKMTRCLILHKELFGDALFVDEGLAPFAVDILRVMFSSRPSTDELELAVKCSNCFRELDVAIEFGDFSRVDGIPRLRALCRSCAKPVGDKSVMYRLGVPLPPRTGQ
jgi:hypothetical protein